MMQTKKSKKVVEEDPEVVAERERLAAFEKELKEYGVSKLELNLTLFLAHLDLGDLLQRQP